MIQGLVQLFIFQALGELVSKFALPFIPGPVLGLVLLLVYLSVRGHVPTSSPLQNSFQAPTKHPVEGSAQRFLMPDTLFINAAMWWQVTSRAKRAQP